MLKWMLIFIVVGTFFMGVNQVDEMKAKKYLANKYDEEKKKR